MYNKVNGEHGRESARLANIIACNQHPGWWKGWATIFSMLASTSISWAIYECLGAEIMANVCALLRKTWPGPIKWAETPSITLASTLKSNKKVLTEWAIAWAEITAVVRLKSCSSKRNHTDRPAAAAKSLAIMKSSYSRESRGTGVLLKVAIGIKREYASLALYRLIRN